MSIKNHSCNHTDSIGIVAFTYQGITYTTRDKVVDIGPVHMTTEKTNTIPLPPILGGIALVGGIVLLVAGLERRDQMQHVSTTKLLSVADK